MKNICKNPNKKEQKRKNADQRILVPFNTGTRTHKSKKEYNRQKEKLFCKKYLTN